MKKTFRFFVVTFLILSFVGNSNAQVKIIKGNPSPIYVETRQFVYEKTDYMDDRYVVDIVENEDQKVTKIIDKSAGKIVDKVVCKKRKLYAFEHVETNDFVYTKDFEGLRLELTAKYDHYVNGSFREVLNVRDAKLRITTDDEVDKDIIYFDVYCSAYEIDYTNVGFVYNGRIEIRSPEQLSKKLEEKLLNIGFKHTDSKIETNGTYMFLDLEHIGRLRLYY